METHYELHEVYRVETEGEINPWGNIGESPLKTLEMTRAGRGDLAK